LAGPGDQQVLSKVIPPGEAQVQYSATALAYKVQNLEATPEGTLRTIRGSCPYEINRSDPTGAGARGDPELLQFPLRGIHHASLLGGVADMLVVSAGSQLLLHKGWSSATTSTGATDKFVSIKTGLAAPSNLGNSRKVADEPRYPDQFLVMNELVIWTNGLDQPQVITTDFHVSPLGFAEIPGSPSVEGPQSADHVGRANYYPNSLGYSWPGKIGTAGDALSADGGGVRDGYWVYHIQFEDPYGNLSGTSSASAPASIISHKAQPLRGAVGGVTGIIAAGKNTLATEIRDLTRQFLVRYGGDLPDNAIACRLYRTPDIANISPRPRFLARIPIGRQFVFPDNISDSELVDEMVATVPTPIFRVMCAHQGRLVVGNVAGAPGLVRRSAIGSPGTFPASDFVYPDSGGAEVTAVVSHEGVLLAFTASSVYSLQEFGQPRPLSQGIGCVAPKSVKTRTDGMLIWLGRDGFYGMRGGQIVPLSSAIDRTVRRQLNTSRLRQAVAIVDPTSGEYRCALAPKGTNANRLILSFDGANWKRLDIGMHIADWTKTDDWRQLVLYLGAHADIADKGPLDFTGGRTAGNVVDKYHGTGPSVYVMNRETASAPRVSYDAVYQSGWMRGDSVGLTPVHVRSMYIGMADTEDGEYKITFYRNGSWREAVGEQLVKSIGVDDDSAVVPDVASTAVLGTAKAHLPRLFWRHVPVGLENANTWAFKIEANYSTDGLRWPRRVTSAVGSQGSRTNRCRMSSQSAH